jgi:L-ascorbate metabolism protein UlaG (beta-lactamase superfamily)
MSITVRWSPDSWTLIKSSNTVIYIDPAYMHNQFTRCHKRIVYSHTRGTIDGLPEGLEKVGLVLVSHDHNDYCMPTTIVDLKQEGTVVVAPIRYVK